MKEKLITIQTEDKSIFDAVQNGQIIGKGVVVEGMKDNYGNISISTYDIKSECVKFDTIVKLVEAIFFETQEKFDGYRIVITSRDIYLKDILESFGFKNKMGQGPTFYMSVDCDDVLLVLPTYIQNMIKSGCLGSVIDSYISNMFNSSFDCLGDTEDSYAEEMLDYNLYELFEEIGIEPDVYDTILLKTFVKFEYEKSYA